MERRRTFGAMLITAPSPDEVLYEMAVRVARAEIKPRPGYVLHPWLTIRWNETRDDYFVSAGIKAKRVTT